MQLAVQNPLYSLLVAVELQVPGFSLALLAFVLATLLSHLNGLKRLRSYHRRFSFSCYIISSCYIFLLASGFRLASLVCWFIRSSVVVLDCIFGLLLA